jgi:arylsulfatase A-like enzyme
VTQLLAAVQPGQTACLRGYPENSPQPAAAGLYEEDVVTIVKPGITLRSQPGEVAQIKARLTIAAPDVTLSNLVLDGRNPSNFAGLRLTAVADNAKLLHNDITTRSTANCLWADGATPPASAPVENLELRHNRIHDCLIGAILEEGRYASVTDNLIVDNQSSGVRLGTNTDYSIVQRNVIERNANSVQYGTGSDANYVAFNVLSNPENLNVTSQGAPGNYNVLGYNCLWKAGGDDALDPAATSPNLDFDEVVVVENVTADPGYAGPQSEGDLGIAGGNRCHPKTGSMSAAVTDGERPSREAAVNLRPNIMFIVTDDQRKDTMDLTNAAGTEPVMKNTIDWFQHGRPQEGVAGGVRYPRAIITTPVCCPARASIFSGRYVHNNGVEKNTDASKLASKLTLQAYLKRAPLDYYTGIFGKYLNGWETGLRHEDDTSPTPNGAPPNFDEYATHGESYPPDTPVNYGTEFAPVQHGVTGKWSPDFDFDNAIDFVDRRDAAADSEPWFLYVSPSAPHEQAGANSGATGTGNSELSQRWGSEAWKKMTQGIQLTAAELADVQDYVPPGVAEGDVSDKPRWVRDWGHLPNGAFNDNRQLFEEGVYRGLIKQAMRTLKGVDKRVEDLFDKLEETGEADDTLAFFISDNGYSWREHGEHGGDCISHEGKMQKAIHCGLSGKLQPYRDVIEVPFYARWPDNPAIRPDADSSQRESTELVANVDLATTVMDALDEQPRPEAGEPAMDGWSLFDPGRRQQILIEAFNEGGRIPQWDSILGYPSSGNPYHYTHYVDDPQTETPEGAPLVDPFDEYYDLATDPDELQNAFPGGVMPPGFTWLTGMLDSFKACKGTPQRPNTVGGPAPPCP